MSASKRYRSVMFGAFVFATLAGCRHVRTTIDAASAARDVGQIIAPLEEGKGEVGGEAKMELDIKRSAPFTDQPEGA